ncbi:SNF2-family ATP dependent chromatin remodeling factor snf [Salix suchowensis]|nr:SNF2-family ATP dependent chromatin remodeling factor snf [Salix suchowensis]
MISSKRVAKQRKDGHVHARYDEDEMLLLDKKPTTKTQGATQSPTRTRSAQSSPKGKAKATNPPESETEDDESDSEMLLDRATPSKAEPPASKKPPSNHPLPTPADRFLPILVGLQDFRQNLKSGDLVTKAVEDLGDVIMEIVVKPFAMRRKAELLECMEALRETCLKGLKTVCASSPGNSTFWSAVQKHNETLNLITKAEARKHGGFSLISASEAEENGALNMNMAGQQQRPLQQPMNADLQSLMIRANFLRKNPTEQKNPNELENLMKSAAPANGQWSTNVEWACDCSSQWQRRFKSPSLTSGPIPNSPLPPTSQTPISFTNDQINALRAQIHAFKLISRGLPVPDNVQQAIRVPNTAVPELEKLLQGPDVSSRIVDNAVKTAKGEPAPELAIAIKAEEQDPSINPADLPKGPFLEDDVNSGIYPYNAYRHPLTHLKRPAENDPKLFNTRLQRLLIPTLMPQQRIKELEVLPSTIGDAGFDGVEGMDGLKSEKENEDNESFALMPYNTHGKLRAVIELKSLRLLEKQRALRQSVAERLAHGSNLPINRTDYRRTRKPTLRDARMTEQLERRQRTEREKRAKHKHVEQLMVICNHGREVIQVNRAAQDRVVRLGKAVLSFHIHTEKEEQKRIERISKERLRALKADDEEAYMKLIDTAKDTRITHLLRQTDTFLDSLAQAVVAQQDEGGPSLPIYGEMEDGPTSEATFGAQAFTETQDEKGKVDYYAVSHRISEKISRQPSILVGGTLKEYQLKGLQWMVSLYNNRLNGILADEMGLGKTIQTISLITFLIETKRQRGPYLVIVPLSTMTIGLENSQSGPQPCG